jgi:hypothetical protein
MALKTIPFEGPNEEKELMNPQPSAGQYQRELRIINVNKLFLRGRILYTRMPPHYPRRNFTGYSVFGFNVFRNGTIFRMIIIALQAPNEYL